MRKYLPLYIVLYAVIACGHPSDHSDSTVQSGPTTQQQPASRPAQPIYRGKATPGGLCKIQILELKKVEDEFIPSPDDQRFSAKNTIVRFRTTIAQNSNFEFVARSRYDQKVGAYATNQLSAKVQMAEDRFETLHLDLSAAGDPIRVRYIRDPYWTVLGADLGEADISCFIEKLAEVQEYHERPPLFTGPAFLPH